MKLKSMILAFVTLNACSNAPVTNTSNVKGEEQTVDAPESSSAGYKFICTGDGYGSDPIITVGNGYITWQLIGSAKVAKSTEKVAASDAGYTRYNGWSVADAGLKSTDYIEIDEAMASGQPGKALHKMENVGPYYPLTCHLATAAELSADACIMTLKKGGAPLDTDKQSIITQKSGGQYVVTVKDSVVGDYSWIYNSTGSGISCSISLKAIPITCSAVVAAAISDRAYHNGASSGSPFVDFVNGSVYKGRQLDDESGDQYFEVKTSPRGSSCQVDSIKKIAEYDIPQH